MPYSAKKTYFLASRSRGIFQNLYGNKYVNIKQGMWAFQSFRKALGSFGSTISREDIYIYIYIRECVGTVACKFTKIEKNLKLTLSNKPRGFPGKSCFFCLFANLLLTRYISHLLKGGVLEKITFSTQMQARIKCSFHSHILSDKIRRIIYILCSWVAHMAEIHWCSCVHIFAYKI